jgi:outer membrane protein assembly factor BamA
MTRLMTIFAGSLFLLQGICAFGQVQTVPDDRLVIEGFTISGNRVTKEKIITREMVFAVGDTVLKMDLIPKLQRCRENLLNTSLFNFVYLDVDHLENNHIIVEVTVTERWYIWPIPILEYAERNFNEFIKNREWDKIVYGAWLKWSNFRGRKEILEGKVRLGYINEYALSYQVPNLGRKQQHAINTGFSVNHQNEVFIATRYNKPVEYKPQTRPAQIQIDAFAKYSFRRKLYSTHTVRLDYNNYTINDSVMIANPEYLGTNVVNGEPLTNLQYFELTYEFRHDVRDSRIYPLEGFMVQMDLTKTGLGIIPDFPYSSLRATGVLMFHEKLSRRFYFYNATKIRYTTLKFSAADHFPHILNRGLGYHEFLSAYEPYVIDGPDYFITKYNLKFQLVKPTTRTLPLIGMEQFNKIHYALYVNLFADAGYVSNEFPNPTNTMVNTFQFSGGIGLDLVTYYDKVFRVDFAINRYKEYGIFFHLETPFFRW